MREEEGFQFVEVAVSGEGEYIFKMKGGTFTGEDRAARTVSEKTHMALTVTVVYWVPNNCCH